MRIPCASARSAARRIDGPVREGIREREPDLDEIGAARHRGRSELGRLRPGHQVDDERLAQWASTSARSLSPRPESPTRIVSGVEIERSGECVRRLERRQDALRGRKAVKRGECLLVRRRHVLGPAGVAQVRMLGADARVVEAGRDRVRVERPDRPRPRGRTSGSRGARSAVPLERLAAPSASTPTSRTSSSSRKPAKSPIAFEPPPTHATTASGSSPELLEHLLTRLPPDDALQLAHDRRVRVRPDAGADEVVRRLDVRDPVADRLARRLLQRARAELHRAHLGAEEPHALDVRALAAHVLGAHVHDALEPEARADGRRRDAVLPRSGLGDDAPLAEPDGEERLADRVVDLVCPGVQQILALEQHSLAGRREPRCLVERRRAAGEPRRAARRARRGTRGPPQASSQPRESSSSAGTSVSGT